MLNQKKIEIFLRKFHKSLAKQFLRIAYTEIIKLLVSTTKKLKAVSN